jgi:hypothetical protein
MRASLENMSLHSEVNSNYKDDSGDVLFNYLNLFLPHRVSMVVAERHESGSAKDDFLLTGSREPGRR